MIKIVLIDNKIQTKEKIGLRIEMVSFLSFFSRFIMHALSYDQSDIFEHNMSFHIFRIMHACIHHTQHQVKYLMSNLFPKVKKYGSPM